MILTPMNAQATGLAAPAHSASRQGTSVTVGYRSVVFA